ncbi:MAG: NnrS family protein [Alphaproteobacteria bacterium]|nr:NnrS family protein [Alphaproteobacteria bacterium]
MNAIPRYRSHSGSALLSAGFRPFFLLAAAWAALAVPLWLAFFAGAGAVPTLLPPPIWHAHEMIYGYAAATVAGFMLTAIPNWTGRMPLQGASLAGLAVLWIAGRLAVLFSADIGAAAAAMLDLAFPVAFVAVIAREIVAGRNWRNLPMVGALTLLLAGNALVHAEALGWSASGELGNRIGIATFLMLISLIGGRIVPSFTRNWLTRQRPDGSAPASFGWADRGALGATALALIAWIAAPEAAATAWLALLAAMAQGVRLARWRGAGTWREPLLWVLHLGYGWLALGFLLLVVNGFAPLLPATAALHAFTVGAIGTMTLAVMTRASLGHTGRQLAAGPGTTTIYGLVTLAAGLRLLAPLAGANYLVALGLATAAWSGAFGLFVVLYVRPLTTPRVTGTAARPP